MEKSTLSPPPINRMISPSAKKHYTRIVQTLQRHAKTKNEFGYEVDASPVDLVKYLFSERGSYRPRTFLGYRTVLSSNNRGIPSHEFNEVKGTQ